MRSDFIGSGPHTLWTIVHATVLVEEFPRNQTGCGIKPTGTGTRRDPRVFLLGKRGTRRDPRFQYSLRKINRTRRDPTRVPPGPTRVDPGLNFSRTGSHTPFMLRRGTHAPLAFRGGPLWCTRFRRVFRSRKWAREIGQKPGEDVVWQRNAGRRQPPPQAHFISPNPPRHSRRSVSDGVIQLRVPLAGCAGFFLQAPIPRRILTKMSEAICCMNMRFVKRSWEHPCF